MFFVSVLHAVLSRSLHAVVVCPHMQACNVTCFFPQPSSAPAKQAVCQLIGGMAWAVNDFFTDNVCFPQAVGECMAVSGRLLLTLMETAENGRGS